MIDEDWTVVMSLLPSDWLERAVRTGALKGLRKNKSAEGVLRVLLMHLAGNYNLRETVQRARQAHLGEMSDVALLKRLRKSKNWLAALCVALFRERGIGWVPAGPNEPRVRLIDGTTVEEPGATGSVWLIHYGLSLPSLQCDYLKVTPAKGGGNGESFQQHPIRAGDYVMADRGYATGPGLKYVAERQGFILVRFSPHNLPLWGIDGKRLDWGSWLAGLKTAGEIRSERVWAGEPPGKGVEGRICVVRKTQAAIEQAQKKLRRRANKNGQQLRPETLVYAEYVTLFTTFPEASFPPVAVTQWYRLRWQIELVFKRFKSIAQLGHLIKHDEESSKAWLYGKLLVALLVDKLHSQARAFSPWGCLFAKRSDA
jgi:hypothetical protein